MYLGSWKIDDYVNIPVTTHRFSTGGAYAPTVLTYSIYEDGNNAGIDEDVDMVVGSPFDGITGFYLARRQLTTADGFEKGKNYTILIKATVDGVSAMTSHTFQIEAEVCTNSISADAELAITEEFGEMDDLLVPLSTIQGLIDDLVSEGVLLKTTQGAITWGAQYVVAGGGSTIGLAISGSNEGVRIYGGTKGIDISGGIGANVRGLTTVGIKNEGVTHGQQNIGATKDIDGYDTDLAIDTTPIENAIDDLSDQLTQTETDIINEITNGIDTLIPPEPLILP